MDHPQLRYYRITQTRPRGSAHFPALDLPERSSFAPGLPIVEAPEIEFTFCHEPSGSPRLLRWAFPLSPASLAGETPGGRSILGGFVLARSFICLHFSIASRSLLDVPISW
jgi:hypothetical protein